MHQFVGEQDGLDKAAARNVTESAYPPEFFLLYFQTIRAVTVHETNRYMQLDAKARNKLDIKYSQQTCVKIYMHLLQL